MEQFKTLFDKLSYQIDSRQIMIMVNPKQGMAIPWEKIEKAGVYKDEGFVFYVTMAQLIYLPYKVFNGQHEIGFVNALLKRKGFVNDEK